MTDEYRTRAQPEPDRPWERPWRRYFVLGAGVALPIGAVAFELGTSACSEVVLDPLPTPLHVGLVLLVPLANALVSWRRALEYPRLLWGLTGAALLVSVLYALVFLPLTPIAVLLTIYYGLGVLPLSPLLAVIATLLGRRLLAGRAGLAARKRVAPSLAGMAVAGALLLGPAAFELAVQHGLERAAAPEPGAARDGREFLRAYVSDDRLLELCGDPRGRKQPLLLGFLHGSTVDAARAAEIYYRVTGRLCARPDGDPDADRFIGRGPPAVAQDPVGPADRDSNVVLAASRIDGSVDAAAAVGYLEWTLSFENRGRDQREARALVELPPNAVVSRATLWVAGEPREAAFAGRAEATQAYERVVSTRKDPLLVTSAGPSRVEIRCFPVVKGSEMRIRIGITAPLDGGELVLPRVLRRSFAVRAKHEVWIEADTAFRWGERRAAPAGTGFRIQRGLDDAAWNGAPLTLAFDALPDGGLAWAEDTSEPGFVITQRIERRPAPAPARVVLVVDGAVARAALRAASRDLPAGVEIAAFAAGDDAIELLPPARLDGATQRRLDAALAAFEPQGGADNAAALTRALELGGDGKTTTVLWLHGAVPYAFRHPDRMGQLLERGTELELLALQVAPGSDRLTEALERAPRFRTLSFHDSLETSLRRLFRSWAGAPLPQVVRTRQPRATATPEGKHTSKHLVRLWARDEVERLAAERRRDEAIRLSGVHQLVTSVSGAVVLETRQQFAEAGLTPAAPDSVPSVPEPGFWIIVGAALLLGAALWLRQRRVRVLACT